MTLDDRTDDVTNRNSRSLRPLVAIIALLALNAHAETVTYYATDHLGSPVAAMDAEGNVLWRESYTPYGEKRENPSGADNDTGYTGHQSDDVTGLTYMQARYYDPVVGRFMATDPVPFDGGNPRQFGRYLYGQNSPESNFDPDGRDALSAIRTTFSSYEYIIDPNGRAGDRIAAEIIRDTGISVKVAGEHGAQAAVAALGSATTSENLNGASDALATATVIALLSGEPEVALVTGAASSVLGIAGALRSDTPGTDVAIEIGAQLVGAKYVGTATSVVKGIANSAPRGAQNAIDAAGEAVEELLEEKLKEAAK